MGRTLVHRLSVLPERQGQGIGRALMEHGLAKLRELGAKGCVLVGDQAFDIRFGFANTPALMLDGVPQQFFLSLSLNASSAQGQVKYHAALTRRANTTLKEWCCRFK
nr:N-acetyltransferase [Oryzomicrobium sp.]